MIGEIRTGRIVTSDGVLPVGAAEFAVVPESFDRYNVLVVWKVAPRHGHHGRLLFYPSHYHFAERQGYQFAWSIPRQYVELDPPAPVEAVTPCNRLDRVYFDELDLAEEWGDFNRRHPDLSRRYFLADLRVKVLDPEQVEEVAWCADCGEVTRGENLTVPNPTVQAMCDDCLDDWSTCYQCEDRFHINDLYSLLGEDSVCLPCRDRHYSWCSDCEGYYHHEDSGDHDHSDCDCESPQREFTIRNDGHDPLPNDTRVTVTLPAGVISEVGLNLIYYAIMAHGRDTYIRDRMYSDLSPEEQDNWQKWHDLAYALREQLGDKWQTTQGNYTKRLSRLAYKTQGIKVPPEVISEVGNVASAHSAAVDFAIETTRDLNLPREHFLNEGSCWWSDYFTSRCAFKANGGFGIRTFSENCVEGRMWVIPLRYDAGVHRLERRLAPTFETQEPDAFIVFNGYGDLEGYTGARMLAHMAGWTYTKVALSTNPMYVNSDQGYLVGPEEIVKRYTDGRVHLDAEEHSDLYEVEQSSKEMADA